MNNLKIEVVDVCAPKRVLTLAEEVESINTDGVYRFILDACSAFLVDKMYGLNYTLKITIFNEVEEGKSSSRLNLTLLVHNKELYLYNDNKSSVKFTCAAFNVLYSFLEENKK